MPASHAFLAKRMQLKRSIVKAAMSGDSKAEKRYRAELAAINAKINKK
jgi:hypothetical protein|tara:strand:+ start:261 stop:404 length:144 start_codon:yes stop_codon:yes gene_type:complete